MISNLYLFDNASTLCSPHISIVNSNKYYNDINKLKKLGNNIQFRKGEHIISIGDKVNGVYLLTSGKIRASIVIPQGKEK